MNKGTETGKILVGLLVNIIVICLALFVPEIRHAPFILLLFGIIIFAYLQTRIGSTFELIAEKVKNQQLQSETQQLRLSEGYTRRELNELQQVMVSFLEHSDIYRERIKEKIRIEEDYICIVKSSEGLSNVFNEMVNREMFPFASVLMRIPGTIKPFERIALFLIPIKSLSGINEWNLRLYINSKIIPLVKEEREQYLSRTTKIIARKADPFSYKYIAFVLRKGTIIYDVKNRKFNHAFNEFLIENQSKDSYNLMKEELRRVITVKDILAIVNWSSFAKLNETQKELVDKCQYNMSIALKKVGIETLTQLSEAEPKEFLKAVWPTIKRYSTKIKGINLSTKIIDGARNTINILRRNGMNI